MVWPMSEIVIYQVSKESQTQEHRAWVYETGTLETG